MDGDHLDEGVRAYRDAVPPEHRDLFDRVHRLILATCPNATVSISYHLPTYRVGRRRLFLGAWKHGVSLYGWGQGNDSGFLERYPQLRTSTGTIRLRPQDADTVPDQDLADLIRTALSDPARSD